MKRFAGERRALAAAVLAFYGLLYLLQALMAPPEWTRALGAMALVYGVGFVAVVAQYFWGRWYAIGLGLSGVITSTVALWQMGAEPVFLFYGGTHGAIAMALWGDGVARGYDGREEWRTRFHLDEHSVHRLGKAVIRIGISLPYILLYALAPKPPSSLDDALLALATLGLAGAGTWAMLRLRTWGLVALTGAAGLLAIGATGAGVTSAGPFGIDLGSVAAFAAVLLVAAVVPFARPVVDYLRRR